MENKIDCPDCEGTGKYEGSNCCGAPFWAETDICSACKEHADDTCDSCEGTGKIDNKNVESTQD